MQDPKLMIEGKRKAIGGEFFKQRGLLSIERNSIETRLKGEAERGSGLMRLILVRAGPWGCVVHSE
jgi:hypothetical protein